MKFKQSMILMILLLCSVSFLSAGNASNSKWSVYFGGAFFSEPKFDHTGITLTWDEPLIWGNEEITSPLRVDQKPTFGFEAGIIRQLGLQTAIRVEFSTRFAKEFESSGDYTWTGKTSSGDFLNGPHISMGETKLSSTRISLLLDHVQGKKIKFHFLAGPSLVFNKVEWNHDFYYALTMYNGIYFDLFRLPAQAEESKTCFGFTAGLEIAYPITTNISIYVAGKYHLSGKFSGSWEVPAGEYSGIDDKLIWTIDEPTIVGAESYQWEVNPSVFQVSVGAKLGL